jgi:uncharacterized protein YeaO (DUF488 family)
MLWKGEVMIRIKRAYDPPARGDGRRLLVERLWPRGVKKESLAADAWLKDVAPSTELRQWFGHRVEHWDEFRTRYLAELKKNPEAWRPIVDEARGGTVTLLYSAHDLQHNSAVVLRDYLSRRLTARAPASRARRTPSARPPRVDRKGRGGNRRAQP